MNRTRLSTPSWRRAALLGCLVVLLALISLHAYNFVHLDLAAMRADAEPLLARAPDQ